MQLLAEDSVPIEQLDEGAQKQLAVVGQQQKVRQHGLCATRTLCWMECLGVETNK